MIRVNKRERDYLVKNGCKYRKDLHTTIHGKTYATESPKVLGLLEKLYKR